MTTVVDLTLPRAIAVVLSVTPSMQSHLNYLEYIYSMRCDFWAGQRCNLIHWWYTRLVLLSVSPSLDFELTRLFYWSIHAPLPAKISKYNVPNCKVPLLALFASSIFTNLAHNGSIIVEWGSEVAAPTDPGQTSTKMGSGYFPTEGFRKAS